MGDQNPLLCVLYSMTAALGKGWSIRLCIVCVCVCVCVCVSFWASCLRIVWKMRHLYPTPPKYCLSAHPIINPLTHTYTSTVFRPRGVSYFFSQSLSPASVSPLLLSVFKASWLKHTLNKVGSKTALTCHGRAFLVMFCPIFLSAFRSQCCGRALDGFVLTRLPQKDKKRQWERERTVWVDMYIIIIIHGALCLFMQQQIYGVTSTCHWSG